MQEMAANYGQNTMSLGNVPLGFEAGCEADHILTYLNSMVDDVACAIVDATGYVNPKRPVDSMGALKSQAREFAPQAPAPVIDLLSELDNAGSWWELAFKPKIGARQLLIHNHHFVAFTASRREGHEFLIHANLIAPYTRSSLPNFFELLRAIFANLFDWLDRLQAALTDHLRAKSGWISNPAFAEMFAASMLPLRPGRTVLHEDYCGSSD